MDIEKIRAKITAKQEMINLEKDQNRKNELIKNLKVLQMRMNMEKTHEEIKKMTNRD